MSILKSLRESHGWRISDAIESGAIGSVARFVMVFSACVMLVRGSGQHYATMTALVLLASIDGRLKEIGEKLR